MRTDLTRLPVRFFTVKGRYLVVHRNTQPVEILRVLSVWRDVPNLLG
jgi:hypothetical protein